MGVISTPLNHSILHRRYAFRVCIMYSCWILWYVVTYQFWDERDIFSLLHNGSFVHLNVIKEIWSTTALPHVTGFFLQMKQIEIVIIFRSKLKTIIRHLFFSGRGLLKTKGWHSSNQSIQLQLKVHFYLEMFIGSPSGSPTHCWVGEPD